MEPGHQYQEGPAHTREPSSTHTSCRTEHRWGRSKNGDADLCSPSEIIEPAPSSMGLAYETGSCRPTRTQENRSPPSQCEPSKVERTYATLHRATEIGAGYSFDGPAKKTKSSRLLPNRVGSSKHKATGLFCSRTIQRIRPTLYMGVGLHSFRLTKHR